MLHRVLIVLYQIKCGWTDMMWEECIQSMIYVSGDERSSHLKLSLLAFIISEHIKTDYTCSVGLHPSVLSNLWFSCQGSGKKEQNLYIRLLNQAQRDNFALTDEMTPTKIQRIKTRYGLTLHFAKVFPSKNKPKAGELYSNLLMRLPNKVWKERKKLDPSRQVLKGW